MFPKIKIKLTQTILFVIIFSIIIPKEVDDNDEGQLFEGIIQAMNELKIPYSSYEDTIDLKIYIKLLKHLMLNDADTMGMMSSFLEESFLLKLSREVTQNMPSQIKIKDLPKYLNPRKIEPLINNALNEFDFGSMLKDIGDAFGITDTIKETMKESAKKDKEREKINQARIKRKQEREKAKLNQNKTNNYNNSEGNKTKDNINEEVKNPKRDLRNNVTGGINNDL